MSEEKEKLKMPEKPPEAQNAPKEPVSEPPKVDKPLGERMAHVEAQMLETKRKELTDIEARIDKKMGDFKQFVADVEVQGRSLAAPEQTDEEKQKKELNEALEGTGLKV